MEWSIRGQGDLIQEQSQRIQGKRANSSRNPTSRWKPIRTVEIDLRSPWRKWAFFLLVAVVAVSLGCAVLKKAYVSILGESEDAGKIKRALALDPSDPELHHRLEHEPIRLSRCRRPDARFEPTSSRHKSQPTVRPLLV